MPVKKRKKTRVKRSKKVAKRSSSARRGVTIYLTMRELQKLLGQKKAKKVKAKKVKRRRSAADIIDEQIAREFARRTVKARSERSKPEGTKLSSSTCMSCGGRTYEKDNGARTYFYCPKCDNWTSAIRMGG